MGRHLDIVMRALARHRARLASDGKSRPDSAPQPTVAGIPAGATIVAPRYNGTGEPLAAVPSCWCCGAAWQLDRIEEYEGRLYTCLKPGCACLDSSACYSCFSCRAHCCCEWSQRRTQPLAPFEKS